MLMLMQMQCNYGAKHLRCYNQHSVVPIVATLGHVVPARTAMPRAPLTLLHYSDDPIVVKGGEEGWECG
jgi:hypothetical protein